MKKVTLTIIATAIITGIISIAGCYAVTNYAIGAIKIGYSDNSNLGVDNVQAAIDGTCTKFSTKLNNMMEQIYPVGSIYISTSISDPKVIASTLGIGTWETYGKGKTLVGVDSEDSSFNTVGKTGGSKSKTLTVNQIPSLTTTGTTTATKSGSTGDGYSIGYSYSTRTTTSAGSHSHTSANGGMFYASKGNGKDELSGVSAGGGFSGNDANSGFTRNSTTDTTGNHSHNYDDYYANSISGVAAHTHSIPSLSVSTKYTNNTQASINIQNPYITVYMYKRTA